MAKVFVICGHGAGDPGATSGGYTEAERVRALAKRIKYFGGNQVSVGDTSRNWYADNGIGRGQVPKGYAVIELHMDSASASARGGHVIIKSGFSADDYDKALANFISSMFPGRSKSIVERSDLANVNRAASMGINYRLLECCFISNPDDLQKFNTEMDKLAKGILAAFGLGGDVVVTPEPQPEPKPVKPTINAVSVDGWWGPSTTKALQKIFGTTQDGIVSGQDSGSKKYHVRCDGSSWKYGSGGSNVIKALQAKIGADQDRYFGPATIKALQRKLGVDVDGYCGPGTVTALQKWINNGCN